MAEDSDAGESFRFGSGLCLGDRGLEGSRCGVSFTRLRNDKAESDEVMRVGESKQVVPVFLVKTGERSQDEDYFLICSGIGGCSKIVEFVMHDRRRNSLSIALRGLYPKGGGCW